MIRLGIDTGGTYTDAVVVDIDTMEVLAKAKSLTTKEDLALGIGAALDALPMDAVKQASSAALSTTLATNACVEGKGGRAKLIIVGTTPEVLRRVDAQGKFGIPYNDVLALDFVGSYDGREVTIPDWDALYEANPTFFDEADSFGIASLYALNNGAVVEKSGAAFLRERFGKLVVEATTVATEINVIGRGATALLNARLVPLISNFLDAIDKVFSERGLDIPVSVVRSDGSLMSEELARIRPVETILSGPAASVTGARALSGAPESLIVDIGGTTSDICIVHNSRPNRTTGISIGGWKTQVSGVEIDTIALGGDTEVRYTKNSRLELGSRRVMPLCIAASRWPSVKESLSYYLGYSGKDMASRYELYCLLRDPGDLDRFTDSERSLLALLQEGPVSLFDERMSLLGSKSQRLEDEGIIIRCGMTPTDAMHMKGDFTTFDVEASRLGAQCILRSYRGIDEANDESYIAMLADEIYSLAQLRLYGQVIGAYAQDTFWPDGSARLDPQMQAVIDNIWSRRNDDAPMPFGIRPYATARLVGIGAPTHVFIHEVGRVLDAPVSVPEHAEVANAVGAAVSHVEVVQQVRVSPLRDSDGIIYAYQMRGTDAAETFDHIEDALVAAREQVRDLALKEAHRRGATGDLECRVQEERDVYRSTGTMNIVREWTLTATVN